MIIFQLTLCQLPIVGVCFFFVADGYETLVKKFSQVPPEDPWMFVVRISNLSMFGFMVHGVTPAIGQKSLNSNVLAVLILRLRDLGLSNKSQKIEKLVSLVPLAGQSVTFLGAASAVVCPSTICDG
ncbi:hypothetical protein BDZ91DRAFT_478063 [Kalaharituber pfeilii]|nr:hypothetical protein BDZ91DRAFT_478063 [Kalaharituber pfeilii]